jgi:glutathione S-transferase
MPFNLLLLIYLQISGGKWELVPTVVFPNGDIVFDSPKIAKYLDEKYPENPLNPNNPDLDALVEYYDKNLFFPSFKNVVDELYARLDDENKRYFKETRERFFNVPIEKLSGDREANNQQYNMGVKRIDDILSTKKFLDGDKPLIHDYTIASRIQCFKILSPKTYEDLIINGPNMNLRRWIGDMDEAFGGYLGKLPTF